MTTIEKSAQIPATPDRVFALLADRQNAPKLLPNLVRIWDVRPAQAAKGQTWQWEYRLLGLSFEGQAGMLEFEPDRKLRFRTQGKLASTWTYACAPAKDGTLLTVSVEYELPGTLLAKLADKVAYHRLNESQIEQLLVNVRVQLV